MATLFDVFGRLLLEGEGKQFVAQAVKAGEKAGDQAGQTMGQRLAKGVRSALGPGLKVAAAGAAAVFGVATRGAIEMEDAMARYRAETGATAEEAKRALGAVNQIAGRQQQSLEAVTDVAIRVKRDLGAVGEEADKLTEDFTRFARVTRQDAAGAVSEFDDILDSWGLTTADAAGLMDRLLVSQQKFGGSITDNQKTLAALAPALRAANFEVDDAISLLGLFGAKGLDAASGSAAFAKALTKVESPEELQRLIADISATEDPFERARKAADLFGARAGAKLANALAGANLDDYAISMDEAAGATTKAADALDSSFGGRFRKLMSEAGAAVRGFGSELGPALTGVAALASLGGTLGLDKVLGKGFAKLAGSALVRGAASKAGFAIGLIFTGAMFAADKLGSALSVGLNALPGSALVKGAAGKVGALLGTNLGKAGAAAFAAFMVVEVVNTYNQVKAGLAEQNAQISKDVANQIATGTTSQLQQTKAALESGLEELSGVWDAGLFTNETRAKLQADLAATSAELERRAAQIPGGVAAGLEAGQGEVTGAADEMVDGIPGEVEEANAEAAAEAAKTPQEIAAGILSTQGAVGEAMAALTNQIENEKTRAQEIAYLIGVLTSTELANGLKDKRPGVRAQAEATRQIAEARLAELQPASGKIGRKSNDALAAGMKSKDPAVRAQAKRTKGIVETSIKPNTAPAGQRAINTMNTQLRKGSGRLGATAAALARTIVTRLMATVQAGLNTPGRYGYSEKGRAAGGRVYEGQAYIVGENRPELFVPDVTGTIMPRVPPATQPAPYASGSSRTEINLQTYGLPMRAETPAQVVRRIKRASRLGTVAPKPRVPGWEGAG